MYTGRYIAPIGLNARSAEKLLAMCTRPAEPRVGATDLFARNGPTRRWNSQVGALASHHEDCFPIARLDNPKVYQRKRDRTQAENACRRTRSVAHLIPSGASL